MYDYEEDDEIELPQEAEQDMSMALWVWQCLQNKQIRNIVLWNLTKLAMFAGSIWLFRTQGHNFLFPNQVKFHDLSK